MAGLPAGACFSYIELVLPAEIASVLRLCLPLEERVATGAPDTAILLEQAERLGVFPPVFNNLLALGQTASLDADSMWWQLFRQIYARNLAIERRQESLLEALTAAGIGCHPIKGVRLIELLYPDLSWRQVADIDLLVAPGSLVAAYEKLKSLGLGDAWKPWNSQALERQVAAPAYSFAEVMLLAEGGIPVELHWDWVDGSFPARDPVEDREAYLVYLCRHAGKHFWSSVQWACDIEVFLRTFGGALDWVRFWEVARAAGAERSCAGSFHLCALLFERPLRAEEERVAASAGRELSREAASRLCEQAQRRTESRWSDHPAWRLLKVYNWRQRVGRSIRWLAPPAWHWNEPGSAAAIWLRRYRRLAFQLAARAVPSRLWRGRLEKAADLSLGDWARLGEAFGTLLFVSLALRVVSFQRLRSWAVAARRPPRVAVEEVEALVARQAWLVEVAANHHLLPMRCLARSLALARMLGRRGIETEIKMGVRREEDEQLHAHAWLEWRGQSINDPGRPEEEYAPLEPAAARR